eukprot:462188-Prorocentrum_minimum.AAC.7
MYIGEAITSFWYHKYTENVPAVPKANTNQSRRSVRREQPISKNNNGSADQQWILMCRER